ncbi:MAG TPA: TetR/AcrR family transcriptional regulator [Solimonas sp.]|nr:TetR/AcrR family transcriptional regulator [Solimonas sp.]
MGRQSNTAQRRGEIVAGLLAELAAVGYERASTKSIARRAGLAPGLVHYHFRNKQDILLELVDGLIADADRRCNDALAAGDDPLARLSAFVTSRLSLGATSDARVVKAWVSVMAESLGQPKVRARLAKWFAGDHNRIERLFAEAGVAAAGEHAAMLLSMILGTFSLRAIGVSEVPQGYAEARALEYLKLTCAPVRRATRDRPVGARQANSK